VGASQNLGVHHKDTKPEEFNTKAQRSTQRHTKKTKKRDQKAENTKEIKEDRVQKKRIPACGVHDGNKVDHGPAHRSFFVSFVFSLLPSSLSLFSFLLFSLCVFVLTFVPLC
jgi:hypothetical protein